MPGWPTEGCEIDIEKLGDSRSEVIRPWRARCLGNCPPRFGPPHSCMERCSLSARPDAIYELTWPDDSGLYFAGWFGDCFRIGADNATCVAPMGTGARHIRAHFLPADECLNEGWCREEGAPSIPGVINSLFGTGVSDVWAVGDGGAILHSDGISWTRTPVPPEFAGRNLYGVWSAGPGDAWAVGEGGTILHWNGKDWSEVPSGTGETLRAVWGGGPPPVWAVGDHGTILHWDGTNGINWTPEGKSLTGEALRGIWGPDPSEFWVVGDKGTILSSRDNIWHPFQMPVGEREDLHAVGGTRGSVWAVGTNGSAYLRREAATWEKVSTNIKNGATLSAVWSGPDAAPVAVGDGGVVISFENLSWHTKVASAFQMNLRAAWGGSPTELWLAGDGGAVIRRRR